jgi:hypothetical protein
MTEIAGKYDEVYALIRIDAAAMHHRRQPKPKDFLVVKIMRSEVMAREEVERLNAIGRGKGHFYFYQVTRLERLPGGEG